jgi:citrate lyase synthetase
LAAAAAELQLAEVERRRENIANINACRVRAKVSGKNAARSGTGTIR